jgi:predicted 3-demethylubiquinone-9 3-methyltransferase (glyoxalase superfamily)
MAKLEKIVPNLWFDTQAEDAARFYCSVFKNSSIDRIAYFTEAGRETHRKEPGSVMTVEFYLEGQKFIALNGGPNFKFNEAISFVVSCKKQSEIDFFWEKLSEGGDPASQQCGWLKDKFGLSWQIVPTILSDLMSDREKGERIMETMMKMKKIDIEELKEAAKEEVETH